MGNEKSNAAALLPIGVFLVIFLGSGVITGDFYACLLYTSDAADEL